MTTDNLWTLPGLHAAHRAPRRSLWKITRADLERHLPAELPFRGHILKRMPIQMTECALVCYRCDTFFDCPQHSHLTGMMMFERVYGMMFERVYAKYLLETLRRQLRIMYWWLEREVAKETAQGCSILPPAAERATVPRPHL